jgi:antitoxin HicB
MSSSAKTTAKFTFPVQLTPDDNDGGYTVTFPDLPEAITQGDSITQCLTEAVDCLEEAIAARIDDNLPIPQPSLPKLGEYLVELPLTMVSHIPHVAIYQFSTVGCVSVA